MFRVTKESKYVILHCLRANSGGEEVALDNIDSLSSAFCICTYPKVGILKGVFLFLFSFSFALFVIRNKGKRFIFSNPFSFVSIPSLLLLRVLRIPLRWYIHNFSVSCPANVHFLEGRACFKSIDLGKRNCMKVKCSPSFMHYLLNILRNVVFYNIFVSGNKNKFYFVSKYQAELARQIGIKDSKVVVAGNVL